MEELAEITRTLKKYRFIKRTGVNGKSGHQPPDFILQYWLRLMTLMNGHYHELFLPGVSRPISAFSAPTERPHQIVSYRNPS